MKSYLVFLPALLVPAVSFARKKTKPEEYFFVLDKDWKGTADISKGTYFMRERKMSDSLWNVVTYNMFGPLVSVEYSIDEEALLLVNASPKWTPASQDGKKVKSYKKQPIIFRFE